MTEGDGTSASVSRQEQLVSIYSCHKIHFHVVLRSLLGLNQGLKGQCSDALAR